MDERNGCSCDHPRPGEFPPASSAMCWLAVFARRFQLMWIATRVSQAPFTAVLCAVIVATEVSEPLRSARRSALCRRRNWGTHALQPPAQQELSGPVNKVMRQHPTLLSIVLTVRP